MSSFYKITTPWSNSSFLLYLVLYYCLINNHLLANKLKKIFLFLGDIVVLYLSLYLTLILRYRAVPTAEIWHLHFGPFTWFFGVWIVIFYINGLYDIAASKNDIEFYNKLLSNILVNFGLAAAYFYLLTDKLFDIKPRAVFFIFISTSLVLMALWRYWYNSFVQRPKFMKNVLLIGMKDEALELVKEIMKKPQLGYKIAGILHNGHKFDYDLQNVKVFQSPVNLKEILANENISTVVTALNPHTNPDLVQNLYESLALKLQFFDLPTFYEKLTGKIPVTTIGRVWFLENLAEGEKTFFEIVKRGFDIIFAGFLLVLTLPLIPFIALIVKFDSPGMILFRQIRIGLLGKPFSAIKFRSMVVGAEKDGQPQWAQSNDRRVTRFGNFLRKTRLDEIPQLLNVLKGEMSLVGPRPERPEFVTNLQTIIPFYNERHLIKPGLTGWAQINFQYGASVGDALKKLQFDLFYIKNRSIPLDIGILLKTINIIITGKGR